MIERHFSAYKGELSKLYGFKKGYLFLDLTLGDGGHTQEALEAGCRVVSFDIDIEAIKRAVGFVPEKFSPLIFESENITLPAPKDFNWIVVRGNFTKVSEIVQKLALPSFDGVMVDLGPSQYQILSPDRGFSFSMDEPLDMRLTKDLGVTAADLLAVLNEGELADLFALGDEPFAKPLARIIVKQRSINPIKTTKQLADIVQRVKRSRSGRIHPATQVFMALRMVVNLERENIHLLLPQLPLLLKKSGQIGIISFHSGEDKLIKDFIKAEEDKGVLSAITEKPIVPSLSELSISPRTRSAKLRIAKKIN
ncbi:MAG TPA: 16S rRNA (cytosine(1402)-N(4))-methyltransferase RsmH [Candidatus Woesebacteria bacterium]|nr:16S rRNA (cytosine(1402)-N(4))-methyltransferase RsmH [Candidatus Woesebacteria bacterium]